MKSCSIVGAVIETQIEGRYVSLVGVLNEAETRLWAAAEARVLGRGGVAAVARATRLSRNTILAGLRELDDPTQRTRVAQGHVRRPGAGRKHVTEIEPQLAGALERLVSPATRGDPMSPLRWSSKSAEKLAVELRAEGFTIDAHTVGSVLKAQGYSLQAPRKTLEGGKHPDRDAQFQFIAAEVARRQAQGQPVISVDCKKKELVGAFKNSGREWQPKGHPEAVNVYDFASDALFKAIPYGVYDVTRNEGWVNVGIDHETAEFAVASIAQWWRRMGRSRYPKTTELYITADGGGGNGVRNKLWKRELQALADRTRLTIHISHLPPGTSKWNKIEHRLFSQITMNWRGKPLATLEAVVGLIANTTTKTGLKVRAAVDRKSYPLGQKVSAAEIQKLALTRKQFHGDWNYSITHRRAAPSEK